MSDILAQFKALKLYGMASSYAELRQQNTPDQMRNPESADRILSQLLQAESTERNIRSIRYQIQAARFLVQRHLQGFDFSQSKVDQQLIQQLATMEFTTAAQNLVLIGGTGTGKTHLANNLEQEKQRANKANLL